MLHLLFQALDWCFLNTIHTFFLSNLYLDVSLWSVIRETELKESKPSLSQIWIKEDKGLKDWNGECAQLKCLL